MEKHNEFQEYYDYDDNGTHYRLTFTTTEKNNFLAIRDLARKLIDGESEKRWIEVFHKVIATKHSIRNRNIIKYECPECGNLQDTVTPCCDECRIRLARPIKAEREIIEDERDLHILRIQSEEERMRLTPFEEKLKKLKEVKR